MKLFQNGVGRPSNETKKKRRNVYIAITVLVIAIVGVVGCFVVNQFKTNNDLTTDSKNASAKYPDLIFNNTSTNTNYTNNSSNVNVEWRNYTGKTYYYRMLNSKNQPTGSCTKLSNKSFKTAGKLKVSSRSKSATLKGNIYTDSKCKKKVSTTKATLYYDDTKPAIVKACTKGKTLYYTITDDKGLQRMKITSNSVNCSNTLKSNWTKKWTGTGTKKSSGTLNTAGSTKLCVRDVAGNVSQKVLTKCK